MVGTVILPRSASSVKTLPGGEERAPVEFYPRASVLNLRQDRSMAAISAA